MSPKTALLDHNKIANKQKRKELFAREKRSRDRGKREERFRRRKEEEKNPKLRLERRRHNVPSTLDSKRTWDLVDSDNEDSLGLSVDVERIKRQKRDKEIDEVDGNEEEIVGGNLTGADENDELDSMIDSGTDAEEDETQGKTPVVFERAASPTRSTTSTNLCLMPENLAAKFPTLFSSELRTPKILITTSLNSTLHEEASLLTNLFGNSVYIPRSAHKHAHKYSIREISKFASNRNYTTVIVLMEDQKRPSGLDFIHLPDGPHFHFSMNNWIPGKKLPGHGKPTGHIPELILNGFKTPLGLLTAHLFRSICPSIPQLEGRQVLTVHNQRDFLFFRRQEKKPTEKVLQATDGKAIQGVEEIRCGLQELGPRFTLKLRRIDKGIQRSSGQEWKWKGKTDRVRTRFQL